LAVVSIVRLGEVIGERINVVRGSEGVGLNGMLRPKRRSGMSGYRLVVDLLLLAVSGLLRRMLLRFSDGRGGILRHRWERRIEGGTRRGLSGSVGVGGLLKRAGDAWGGSRSSRSRLGSVRDGLAEAEEGHAGMVSEKDREAGRAKSDTNVFADDLLQRVAEAHPFEDLDVLFDVSRLRLRQLHKESEEVLGRRLVLRDGVGLESLEVSTDSVLLFDREANAYGRNRKEMRLQHAMMRGYEDGSGEAYR
jgi:hypothetical protein